MSAKRGSNGNSKKVEPPPTPPRPRPSVANSAKEKKSTQAQPTNSKKLVAREQPSLTGNKKTDKKLLEKQKRQKAGREDEQTRQTEAAKQAADPDLAPPSGNLPAEQSEQLEGRPSEQQAVPQSELQEAGQQDVKNEQVVLQSEQEQRQPDNDEQQGQQPSSPEEKQDGDMEKPRLSQAQLESQPNNEKPKNEDQKRQSEEVFERRRSSNKVLLSRPKSEWDQPPQQHTEQLPGTSTRKSRDMQEQRNSAPTRRKNEIQCWDEWRDFYYEIWGSVNKKTDLIVAVIHYILIRNDFLSIGLGDDKTRSSKETGTKSLPEGWNEYPKYAIRYLHNDVLFLLLGVSVDKCLTLNLLNTRTQTVTNISIQPDQLVHAMCGGFITSLIPEANQFAMRLMREFIEPAIAEPASSDNGGGQFVCSAQDTFEIADGERPGTSTPRTSDSHNAASTDLNCNEPPNANSLSDIESFIAPLRQAIIRYVQVMTQIVSPNNDDEAQNDREKLTMRGIKEREDLLNQYLNLVKKVRGDTTNLISPESCQPILSTSLIRTTLSAGDMLGNTIFGCTDESKDGKYDTVLQLAEGIKLRYKKGSPAREDHKEEDINVPRLEAGGKQRKGLRVKFDLPSTQAKPIDTLVGPPPSASCARKISRLRSDFTLENKVCEKSNDINLEKKNHLSPLKKYKTDTTTKPSDKYPPTKEKESDGNNQNINSTGDDRFTSIAKSLSSDIKSWHQQLAKSYETAPEPITDPETPPKKNRGKGGRVGKQRHTRTQREIGGTVKKVKSGDRVSEKGKQKRVRSRSHSADKEVEKRAKSVHRRHASPKKMSSGHSRKLQKSPSQEVNDPATCEDPYNLEEVKKNFAEEIAAKRLELLKRAELSAAVSNTDLFSISNSRGEDGGYFVPPADDYTLFHFERILEISREAKQSKARKSKDF